MLFWCGEKILQHEVNLSRGGKFGRKCFVALSSWKDEISITPDFSRGWWPRAPNHAHPNGATHTDTGLLRPFRAKERIWGGPIPPAYAGGYRNPVLAGQVVTILTIWFQCHCFWSNTGQKFNQPFAPRILLHPNESKFWLQCWFFEETG